MAIEFNHPVYDEGDVWREESWTFHSSKEVPLANLSAVDYCLFEDGVHYPGIYCPHEDEEDPSWTVLDIPKGQ